MTNLEDVLAQCLTDIETNKSTVNDCLDRYPAHAAALAPLLRTATAVRSVPGVEPSAAFTAAAQTRLANLMAVRQPAAAASRPSPATARTVRRWGTVFARVAAVVVLVSVLLGGTAFAARDSMPDSPLYPIKRTVEQVQVATARGDVRRARVLVGLMDRRALEIASMIQRGNAARALEAGVQYTRLLREAETIADRFAADRPDGRLFLVYMREHLAAQQAIFQRILATSPERARGLVRPLAASNQRSIESIVQRLNGRQ